MPAVCLAAPAKVNRMLHIRGRDAAGYHMLETIFQTLTLADRVSLRFRPGPATTTLHLSGPERGDLQATDDNLAVRAVTAWRRFDPDLGTVRIDLVKNIPAGGGLGGGSSDAAAVLRGLRQLRRPLGPDLPTLRQLALGLGADVPFFLIGGQAHASKRGEVLTPLPDPRDEDLTLIFPPFGCPTGAIFTALTSVDRRPRSLLGPAACRTRPLSPTDNDLWQAACGLRPALAELGDRLTSHGAPWFMTGSGSTLVCLGQVPELSGCRTLRSRLRRRDQLDALYLSSTS